MDQSNIEESPNYWKVFADFNIQITVVNVKLGPVVTLYEILPTAGIKINTIVSCGWYISQHGCWCSSDSSDLWYSIPWSWGAKVKEKVSQ